MIGVQFTSSTNISSHLCGHCIIPTHCSFFESCFFYCDNHFQATTMATDMPVRMTTSNVVILVCTYHYERSYMESLVGLS